MRFLVLDCRADAPGTADDFSPQNLRAAFGDGDVEVLRCSPVPTRAELRALDAVAEHVLADDPTPSLDEIAAQPDVAHLAAPAPAPQEPHLATPVRVVVVGDDAALGAVLTRMMRGDYLWMQVAFVPFLTGDGAEAASPAAANWALPTDPARALAVAATGAVHPVPLIRNDSGVAVAGSATISDWDGEQLTGEIIVDDHVLARHEGASARGREIYGCRLVPMLDAPGIVAARAISPVAGAQREHASAPGWWGRLRRRLSGQPQQSPGQLDPASVRTGRAVQAGGPRLRVSVDGRNAKRPAQRVTFYRHLRDLQVVRPAGEA